MVVQPHGMVSTTRANPPGSRHAADDLYGFSKAESGHRGAAIVSSEHPSRSSSDLGLPESQVMICAERSARRRCTIMVIGEAPDDEKARFDGRRRLVTKPFSPRELKARVRALLRRASSRAAAHKTVIRNGDLQMDLEARTLTRDRQLIHLTPIEWDLLRVLMTNAGKTMTHRQLFAAVWPGRQYGDAQQSCACTSQVCA